MSKQPLPNKSLGQHWLDDAASLQAMVDAAAVAADDSILEIGPGMGSLTRRLVKAAAEVTAVEYDALLAQALPKRVSAPNLRVVQSDILRFDLTTLPPDYKVVANIPYYLTSKLVRVLSESSNSPSIAVLLVQKEVAERLAAKPGALSILGVTAQYYWEVSLGAVVKAGLFTPPPKVDSQIVIMRRRDDPLAILAPNSIAEAVTDVAATGAPLKNFADDSKTMDFDVRLFFRIIKAGFGAKRKTLLNSLSAGLVMPKSVTVALLHSAGVDPGLRAQNLSLQDWYTIYQVYGATIASPNTITNNTRRTS